MKKILTIVEIILLAIGLLSVVLWIAGVADVDMMLYVAYAYFAIAVVVAIVMTAMNMGKSSNKNKIGLYVFGVFAVLAVVFYFVLGNTTAVVDAGGNVYDNPFVLKVTDTMIYLTYSGMAAIILVLLAGEIRKALK